MHWWRVFQHWLAYHTGSLNEPGAAPQSAFWGGIASDLSLIGAAFGFYKRFTCHTWWCPRHGLYDFTDAGTGLVFKLCKACHPAHHGKRLTRKHIARIHERNSGRGPE